MFFKSIYELASLFQGQEYRCYFYQEAQLYRMLIIKIHRTNPMRMALEERVNLFINTAILECLAL